MVPDIDVTAVKVFKDPRFRRMKFDTFDSIRTLHKLTFDIKSKRHAGRVFTTKRQKKGEVKKPVGIRKVSTDKNLTRNKQKP